MAQLLLVLGGVRSGKSRHAQRLATDLSPVTYVATAQAGDEEMAHRIARHRQHRPPDWRTIEEPWDVPAVIAGHRDGTLLLECLSLWLTNLLVGLPGREALDDDGVHAMTTKLCQAAAQATGRVVVVSNETGCGIMPMNALARRFGDLLGEANQELAAAADEVWWCVAGLPQRIKGRGDGGSRVPD